MPTLVLETFIDAAAENCFDLIRDPRVHAPPGRAGRAAAFAADGAIGLGQRVTFAVRHFGMGQKLTLEIVEFERPHLLVDEMIEGVFGSFQHVHEFVPQNGGTLMRDTLAWTSRFGVLGRAVDGLFVEPRLRRLVAERNARLRRIAESESSAD